MASDDEILYFRDTEIITVSKDSLGQNVFQNRFSYERDIMKYIPATGVHEQIVTTFAPNDENRIDAVYLSENGNYLVFEDRQRVIYVNFLAGWQRLLKRDERRSEPIVSEDGNLVLSQEASCSVSYAVTNLATNAENRPFSSRWCGSKNVGRFSPDGSLLYFSDRIRDTVGVWQVPAASNVTESTPRLLLSASELPPPASEPSRIKLSAPPFLTPSTFLIFYTNESPEGICN